MVNKKQRMKMKIYIQSMMAFAAIVSFASCSSEDNVTNEMEGAAKVMTFTATQEGDGASTRAVLATNGTSINWEKNDQIKIFDGTETHKLTLKGDGGSSTGIFHGEANENGSYTAVYPYSDDVSITDGSATGVNLPANQTPTTNSFDKNAALMMAKSTNTTLTFKNAVGYVKVTPKFDCKKIELKAADEDVALAGAGTLTWNEGEPKIEFTEDKSNTITLEGNMTNGTSYYIAVPAVNLKRMWSISFTASDGSKVYTRKGAKPIAFQRNKIINLGEFRTDDDYWYDEHRGIVKATQEVDLGITIPGTDGKTYKVYFAKSNLTATGLAANESDLGDYFAWGALEPWLTSYTYSNGSFSINTWKAGYNSGYTLENAPFYNSSTGSYDDTYTSEGQTLAPEHDAARHILGGDWKLPSKEIWTALGTLAAKSWNSSNNCYVFTNNGNTLFLPATGCAEDDVVMEFGSAGYYWTSTFSSNFLAFFLFINNNDFDSVTGNDRCFGYSVRPVRLVAVE